MPALAPSTIHEMRSWLAVAVAGMEAFVDGQRAPTPGRLTEVLDALDKLDVLMDDLRAPARTGQAAPPTMRLRPVDVCKLIVNETLAIEASAAAREITLDADICRGPQRACTPFLCDPAQVRQVIKNLLLNAIKYTARGGRVKVSCHREPGLLALEISDSGPGVLAAERQTIFEPGVRGSAAGTAAGSGVGLAVVRAILDAHGGTVSVADSPIGGALFVIRLPDATNGFPNCPAPGDRSPLLHQAITPVA